VEGGPYGDAHDAGLGQRRVQDARLAELAVEALGGQEDAALLADVLTQHPDPLVAVHLLVHRFADALDQGLDGHLLSLPPRGGGSPKGGRGGKTHHLLSFSWNTCLSRSAGAGDEAASAVCTACSTSAAHASWIFSSSSSEKTDSSSR